MPARDRPSKDSSLHRDGPTPPDGEGNASHRGALRAAPLLLALAATPAGHCQETVMQFLIPAQPLSSALLLLAHQARISVAAPPELLRGRMSPVVEGGMTVSQALSKLLAPSRLRFEIVSPGVARVLPSR
jgi:outer-membrane receptor for ferric coprogen and ferric-rhodotorulic acid